MVRPNLIHDSADVPFSDAMTGILDRVFDEPDVFCVAIRTQCVFGRGRIPGQVVEEPRLQRVHLMDASGVCQRDLFLEQGVQDDRRATGVFQSLDGVEVRAER